MTLKLAAVLALGLMCGSELNVAAFIHPTLRRQPQDVHLVMRSAFAHLFGRVMPFWMTGSTILNLLLVMPFAHLDPLAWRLATAALALHIFAVVFSIIAAVPLNNRIAAWKPTALPDDWQAVERRWDTYHWLRTCGLIVAFALLALSVGA